MKGLYYLQLFFLQEWYGLSNPIDYLSYLHGISLSPNSNLYHTSELIAKNDIVEEKKSLIPTCQPSQRRSYVVEKNLNQVHRTLNSPSLRPILFSTPNSITSSPSISLIPLLSTTKGITNIDYFNYHIITCNIRPSTKC